MNETSHCPENSISQGLKRSEPTFEAHRPCKLMPTIRLAEEETRLSCHATHTTILRNSMLPAAYGVFRVE